MWKMLLVMKLSLEEPPPRITFCPVLPAGFSFRQEPIQGEEAAERPFTINHVDTNANTMKRGMSFLICMRVVYW